MKHRVIVLAGSLLLLAAGCSEPDSKPNKSGGGGSYSSSTPTASTSGTSSATPDTTTAAKPAAAPSAQTGASASAASPTSAAPAPAPKGYFEVMKDGKTYVVASFASVQKVNAATAASATGLKWVEKTGPNGEAVALESGVPDSSEESLWGEYLKSHPKK
jgi:hypothetical protein